MDMDIDKVDHYVSFSHNIDMNINKSDNLFDIDINKLDKLNQSNNINVDKDIDKRNTTPKIFKKLDNFT